MFTGGAVQSEVPAQGTPDAQLCVPSGGPSGGVRVGTEGRQPLQELTTYKKRFVPKFAYCGLLVTTVGII